MRRARSAEIPGGRSKMCPTAACSRRGVAWTAPGESNWMNTVLGMLLFYPVCWPMFYPVQRGCAKGGRRLT